MERPIFTKKTRYYSGLIKVCLLLKIVIANVVPMRSKDAILRKKNIYIMNDSQSQVFSNSLKRSNISKANTKAN